MKNFDKAVKYSLIFGLVGAVVIPLLYEIYANVSNTLSIVLLVAWELVVAYKFIRLSLKESLIGVTCTLGYTAVLGIVVYCVVHPAVQSYLESHSKYYYLNIQEQARYFVFVAVTMLAIYVIMLLKFFVAKTWDKINGNREQSGGYIENAFDESNEVEK